MKINVLILLALLSCAGASVAHAAEPTFPVSNPESVYTELHSTITVSSATLSVASVGATSRYRQMTIGDPKCPSRVFYTTDGSSANIAVRGDWIDAGSQKTIETGNKVYFQVENGTSPVIVRIYKSEK